VLVLMVIVSHNAGQYRGISEGFVAGVVLVLSYLMVSRIRFRSFKDLSFNRKTIGLFLLAGGCAVAVVVNGVDKAFIFLLLITAYIVLGLTETIIFLKRNLVERHLARRAAHASAGAAPLPAVTTPVEEDAPPADEEVLRELGAFDPTEEDGEGEAEPADAAGVVNATTVEHRDQHDQHDDDEATQPRQVGQPKRA